MSCTCCRCAREEIDVRAAMQKLERSQLQLAEILLALVATQQEDARFVSLKERLLLWHIQVIGGVPVNEPNAFPECCALGQPTASFPEGSGVLIHKRIVLTAAHLSQSNYQVRLKRLSWNANGGETFDNVRLHRHPRYNSARPVCEGRYPFDIGALILPDEGSSVTPAELAATAQIDSATEVNLVGFGAAMSHGGGKGRLRLAEKIGVLQINSDQDRSNYERLFTFDSAAEFVAGFNDGKGGDTCPGDSGGPAYIQVADGAATKKKLAGLTSRGITLPKNDGAPACLKICGQGGVYTRVDRYLDFIKEVAIRAGITDFNP